VKVGPLLGLDIGGSRTRARLVDADRLLAQAEGPGTNAVAVSREAVERRLAALLQRLGGPRPVVCCAGAAGAEVPEAKALLEHVLHGLLPGCLVTVVHDTRLVLPAAGLDAGIALIAGTGSVAYGRTPAGEEAMVGGWGWLLGDDGGGAWVVREAAREVMRRADSGEPVGALGKRLLAAAKAENARQLAGHLHRLREPRRWAVLAPAVFDAAGNDRGAAALVERAGESLAGLVYALRERLAIKGPVVLSGGLLLNQPRLEAAVGYRVGSGLVRLEEPPVAGAVRLALLAAVDQL
jgi:N-acetylglucosamine kinase-like BadF-type ATPase